MYLESYVFFDETDVIVWENDKPAAYNESGVVEIWRLHFPSYVNSVCHFYDILQPDEKHKSSLFYHKKDKDKFVMGRAMLRMILGSYLRADPKALEFTIGIHMKPVLKIKGEIPVHFNLSHSGDYILIAFSDHPVGIDVERYESHLNITEVMEIAFSDKEVKYMKKQRQPFQAFFQLWTRKEALLKAASKGLNNDIKYVPCLNGKHVVSAALLNNSQSWRVSNFPVDKQHIGSIAYLNTTRELRFKQFTSQSLSVFG